MESNPKKIAIKWNVKSAIYNAIDHQGQVKDDKDLRHKFEASGLSLNPYSFVKANMSQSDNIRLTRDDLERALTLAQRQKSQPIKTLPERIALDEAIDFLTKTLAERDYKQSSLKFAPHMKTPTRSSIHRTQPPKRTTHHVRWGPQHIIRTGGYKGITRKR